MTDIRFIDFLFQTANAPTLRTLPDRLAEIVNVRDFGAVGDGNTASATANSAAIQAAFDAAFGSAGAPNGSANAYLNRSVFFPPGLYYCHGLVLTRVYGGRIFGAGMNQTSLHFFGASSGAVLTANGFAYSSIENMDITGPGRVDTSGGTDYGCIELLSNGTEGLHDCAIINVSIGGAKYGTRIAEDGVGGQSISFFNCPISNCYYGVRQNGADCNVTFIGGGAGENWYGWWVEKGSLSLNGVTGAGRDQSGGVGPYTGQTDIRHNSPGITTWVGGRSESQYCIYATQGKVAVYGVLHNLGTPNNFTVDGSGGTAEVSLDTCYCGDPGISATITGAIRGNVLLGLRGTIFARDIFPAENIWAGFTGKITNYTRLAPFSVSKLPVNPAEGLMVPVNDGDATAAWSAAPGTGTGHLLLRYNNTAWTVVGK